MLLSLICVGNIVMLCCSVLNLIMVVHMCLYRCPSHTMFTGKVVALETITEPLTLETITEPLTFKVYGRFCCTISLKKHV